MYHWLCIGMNNRNANECKPITQQQIYCGDGKLGILYFGTFPSFNIWQNLSRLAVISSDSCFNFLYTLHQFNMAVLEKTALHLARLRSKCRLRKNGSGIKSADQILAFLTEKSLTAIVCNMHQTVSKQAVGDLWAYRLRLRQRKKYTKVFCNLWFMILGRLFQSRRFVSNFRFVPKLILAIKTVSISSWCDL